MDDLLAEFDKVLNAHKDKKPKKKSTTGQEVDPLLEEAKNLVRVVKTQQREKRGYQSGNGTDYEKVWNENGTAYTYRPKARVLFEKYHGVKLADHQRVFFANRTLKGDAKYAKENLLLGLKSGVSLDLLTCKNCGCRGNWSVGSLANGEQGSAE